MAKEKINILVLGTGNCERIMEEIVKANEAAGNDTDITGEVINPFDIMLKIEQNDITLKAYRRVPPEGEEISLFNSRDLIPQFDVIIPVLKNDRVGYFGRNVIRHFQLQNIYSTASAYGLENCINQFKILQFLAKDRYEQMPIGSHLFINGPTDLRQTVVLGGGYPLKATISKHGERIVETIIQNDEQAICTLEAINATNAELVLSPFIKADKNKSEYVKAIVINPYTPKAKIFAYSVTVPFDYKSLDGITAPVELSSNEKNSINRAGRLVNLDFAEITLIRKMNGEGSTIISISGTPDIETAEKATTENIASELITHVVDKIRERRKNPKWEVGEVRKMGLAGESLNLRSEIINESIINLSKAAKRIRLINQGYMTGKREKVNMGENFEITSQIDAVIDELKTMEAMKL